MYGRAAKILLICVGRDIFSKEVQIAKPQIAKEVQIAKTPVRSNRKYEI